MPIQTIPFELSPITYYKIVAVNRLRRYWWLYLGCMLIATNHIWDFGKTDFDTFLVLFGFLYPPFLFFYLFIWTTSSKNKAIFSQRQLSMDENMIIAVDADGAKSEIPLSYVNRVVQRKAYWLLYIAKGQFIYIPRSAFSSDEDVSAFEEIISARVKI